MGYGLETAEGGWGWSARMLFGVGGLYKKCCVLLPGTKDDAHRVETASIYSL